MGITIILLLVALLISILWVKGLSNIKEKHPDYKGQDFLADWSDDDKVRNEDIY